MLWSLDGVSKEEHGWGGGGQLRQNNKRGRSDEFEGEMFERWG